MCSVCRREILKSVVGKGYPTISIYTSLVIGVRATGQQSLQEVGHGTRGKGPLGEMQGLEVVKVHSKGVGGTGRGTDVHQLCDNVPHFDVWTHGRKRGGLFYSKHVKSQLV